MANIANLVLVDSAAANRTFTPLAVKPGELDSWHETATGIRVGFPVATLGSRGPSAQSRTSKVTLKLIVPTLEVTAGSTGTGYQAAPKVAYNCLATVDLVFHERSTLLERKNVLSMIKSFLGNAIVTTAVETFDIPT